ncbi:MAG: hypothetical protein DI598_11800 [Pseudopedobacter saltans]|uniref:Lipopolysaccharide biosynthesis protein n=1 Tax=Pseudopedobacter saltans TaxID=151895 RepID=A0A2W5EW36_9SPHI|nr:MAG: hypothetical protein DI598_11800 [Pseudopedobacter saltans]
MPESYGLSTIIHDNLSALGFLVIDISFVDYDFKYATKRQKYTNLLRKLFLRDKNYKTSLKFKPYREEILKKINEVAVFDYSLIIRSDIYPKDVVKLIRKKTRIMIHYQWDGLNRFPLVWERLKYFDKVFVFDQNDALSYGYAPMTNCYFPYYGNGCQQKIKTENQTALFLGSYFKERVSYLNTMSEQLHHLKIGFNCYILHKEDPNLPFAYKYLDQAINYKNYLNLVYDADILIDDSLHMHNGLSFRILEAIGFHKKIITNNKSVKFYDFYNPNNILCLEGNAQYMEQIHDFILAPYINLNTDILEKYSFKNWIYNLLDIVPNIPITLPSV